MKTASGENYNPADWTAAIQTALRGLFKGIKFGKAYRPAFALVESNKKSAVVRINDVGPLKPGRIIDLNERAMRYFDPAMTRGVLAIKITPLAGSPVPGPVNGRATGPAGAV
jgi:rare lipoprotein A